MKIRFATVRVLLGIAVWGAGIAATISRLDAPVATTPARTKRNRYQFGKAAWYGESFHGRPTASGERFDLNQMTAAHRHLPLGTLLRVTNLNNDRAVVVRVNDRGPWSGTRRIIDLSYAASRRLGMVRAGVAPVKLEVLPAD